MEAPSTLGVRIGMLRQRQQLTQAGLARRAGVDRSTLSKVESGAYRSTPVWYVRKLARALDTTTDFLLGMDLEEEQISDRRHHDRGARL